MRPIVTKAIASVAVTVVVVIPTLSQAPNGAKPSFEVATVKLNATGDNRFSMFLLPGGRFVATGVSLKAVMGFAYRIRDFQISGGPNWINTDLWNIEGKSEEGTVPSLPRPPDPNIPDAMALMVQSLIEDRFQLKMHRETKDSPVYELLIAKGGLKIKLSEGGSEFRAPEQGAPIPVPQRGEQPRGTLRLGRGELEGSAVPLALLISTLSQQLGRPIIDKTELKGVYDFKLQWKPEVVQAAGPVEGAGPAPPLLSADLPDVFTAIQEQLGLRLESTKGPVEVLVIDSVLKPAEN